MREGKVEIHKVLLELAERSFEFERFKLGRTDHGRKGKGGANRVKGGEYEWRICARASRIESSLTIIFIALVIWTRRRWTSCKTERPLVV